MTVKTAYFAMSGGVNEVEPPLTVKNGYVLDAMNYEQGVHGGYRRIDGYERYDGSPRPSDAAYRVVQFTNGSSAVSVGDQIGTLNTGVLQVVDNPIITSGSFAGNDAAGRVAVIYDQAGTHGSGDTLQRLVGGVFTENVFTVAAIDELALTEDENFQFKRAAIEFRRSRIERVPGSGPVRGVVCYNDVVYAFRDDAPGTSCLMYAADTDGWNLVGTPALQPGGKFEFEKATFTGSIADFNLYGVDGVNRAFEFDGTTLTFIDTGRAPDNPRHIAEHKRHLFLSYEQGTVQHSSIGEPRTFNAVAGAVEIGAADVVTGLRQLPGDVLMIACRNRTYILYGSSSLSWELREHSDTTGVIEYSLQRTFNAVYADDRGMMSLLAVQDFGDFQDGTFSQFIQERYRAAKNDITTSIAVREKNQYRLHFKGGNAFYVTFDNRRVSGIMPVSIPIELFCARSDEDAEGNERLFGAATNGFVYELDKGTSFDGAAIEAFIKPVFNHFKSPDQRKRFRRISLELKAATPGELSFTPSFSYEDMEAAASRTDPLTYDYPGGVWNVSDWDRFQWSGASTARPSAKIDGTGTNLGMLLYSNAIYEAPHTIYGATLHYSDRRLER